MKINKAKPTYIRQFTKDYDFLNPYYQHLISYHGITYKNAEAAFQAQKNPKYARQFVSLSGPKARTLGSKVMPLPGWEDKQLDVMEDICRAKFSDEELKQKLIATFPAILINGNTRGEKFWGASLKTGIGRNHLGEILTDIREELM
ncbi:MAG: NADAR family protein [Bacilli bacterium]|nr:NADAR family protein [Bacilli bacterium]